jgi:Phosphate-starvation-inducible E family
MQVSDRWNRSKAQWNILTHYQRFESAVAFVLSVVIALIVLVALYRLCVGVVTALLFGAVDPLEHTVFQSVLGEIMTLLIALEFNHTLRYVVTKHQSIIQTKIVLCRDVVQRWGSAAIAVTKCRYAGRRIGHPGWRQRNSSSGLRRRLPSTPTFEPRPDSSSCTRICSAIRC